MIQLYKWDGRRKKFIMPIKQEELTEQVIKDVADRGEELEWLNTLTTRSFDGSAMLGYTLMSGDMNERVYVQRFLGDNWQERNRICDWGDTGDDLTGYVEEIWNAAMEGIERANRVWGDQERGRRERKNPADEMASRVSPTVAPVAAIPAGQCSKEA